MMKCLIVLLAVVALSESQISEADRNTIIDKLNEIRGAAGGSNMRKLIYDSTVTATAGTIAAANCAPAFVQGAELIFAGADLTAGLTAMDAEVTKGKAGYAAGVACDSGTNNAECKVYRDIVNAVSTKVNCDLKTCQDGSSTAHQVIKCTIEPAYTSGDAFTKGTACAACGCGYKCESTNGNLCIVDPDAKCDSGSGVSQLTQNVCLVGLAILCSMLFI